MNTVVPGDIPESGLLLEIGYLALAEGYVREGMRIMDALAALQADAPHPRTGRAVGLHISGRSDEAVEQLRTVVAQFPDAVFARALLAVFLHKQGTAAAQEVALSALALDPPAFIVAMLAEVLGEDGAAAHGGAARLEPSGVVATADSHSHDRGTVSTAFPPGFRGGPV